MTQDVWLSYIIQVDIYNDMGVIYTHNNHIICALHSNWDNILSWQICPNINFDVGQDILWLDHTHILITAKGSIDLLDCGKCKYYETYFPL